MPIAQKLLPLFDARSKYFTVGFLVGKNGTGKLDKIGGLRQKLIQATTYCKKYEVKCIAIITLEKDCERLIDLLRTTGWTVLCAYKRDAITSPLKGVKAMIPCKNPIDEVVELSDKQFILGEDHQLEAYIANIDKSDYEIWFVTDIDAPKRRSSVDPKEIVDNASKVPHQNPENSYDEFNFVREYKPYVVLDEPSIKMEVPPDVKEQLMRKRNDPFATE